MTIGERHSSRRQHTLTSNDGHCKETECIFFTKLFVIVIFYQWNTGLETGFRSPLKALSLHPLYKSPKLFLCKFALGLMGYQLHEKLLMITFIMFIYFYQLFVCWVIVYSDQLLGAHHTLSYPITILECRFRPSLVHFIIITF